jgi:hypothetical protein
VVDGVAAVDGVPAGAFDAVEVDVLGVEVDPEEEHAASAAARMPTAVATPVLRNRRPNVFPRSRRPSDSGAG